jgi:3-oxoacyl-[acyl-carrier-protein] synthase II
MSLHACFAVREALFQAGLDPDAPLPGAGVAMGSTIGSPEVLQEFFSAYLRDKSVDGMRGTVFFKVMSHTVAANVALAFGCARRVLAPAAACASGLMAVGLGYEAVASGREDLMICGGADEFHLLTAATFERLGAASLEQEPRLASRPFDTARQGLVCSEGAGALVLESLERAGARGAEILAEIKGFAMLSTPANIAHPSAEAIETCMREALDDALLRPQDIGYVNAHATATEWGDIAEGRAVAGLFGDAVPVSSLKGHMGHAMAASGALELISCIEMLRTSVYIPTYGLETPDARCGALRHPQASFAVTGKAILKNSFALGGSNCSLVLDHCCQ